MSDLPSGQAPVRFPNFVVRGAMWLWDLSSVPCTVLRVPKAKLKAVSRSCFVVQCHLMCLPPTAVADLLGEGDKVVVGLVA